MTKVKVSITWDAQKTRIVLSQRGKDIARFVYDYLAPLAFLLPDGTYREFPVTSGSAQVTIPFDFGPYRWRERELPRQYLPTLRRGLYSARIEKAWFVYVAPRNDVIAEVRFKTFGLSIVDRELGPWDFQDLLWLLDLPYQIFREVRKELKRTFGFVDAPEQLSRDKALELLVRLLSGAIPPYLWLSSPLWHRPVQVVDDPGFAALVDEAYTMVLLRKETVCSS